MGIYGEAEIGSYNGSQYGNGDVKLEGSALGEGMGSEFRTKVGLCDGM